MVSTDPQRGEPDPVNTIQANFISEGYIKIPLDSLSKDEAVQIINILLNKVSLKEQHQENTREHFIRRDSTSQPQMDEVGLQDFNARRSKLRPCSFCQKRHIFGSLNCEAYGRNCQYCGRRNHSRDACWFLYPHLRRFKFFRKPRSVFRCSNSLRKSFSAPNSLNFDENADQVSRGSGTPLALIQKHSLTTASKVCSRQKDHDKHSKIAILTEAPKQQENLDSGFESQDGHITKDVPEHIQDSHGHKPTWVQSIRNGDFGFDVSSNKLKKVRLFKESEAQSWNEEAWALEQINKSENIQWFESEHVYDYYMDQGGEILKRFIEKFQQLKNPETEEEKARRDVYARYYEMIFAKGK